MEYLIQKQLDNTIHTITYDQIKVLYEDNLKEADLSRQMTASSYRGENFYDKNGYSNDALYREYLERDPRTSGMRLYYPHGVIVEQAARRNFYRGENQLFPESLPSLLRALKRYSSPEERELYRLVADMRIAEFMFLLKRFQHVQNWNYSDVLYEAIAQHYGLETSWLDITNDFNVALFFATCFWNKDHWEPLTRKQTEIDEQHKYGMIFHMPSNRMPGRWTSAIPKFMPWTDEIVGENEKGEKLYKKLDYPIYRGEVGNLIYPLGFQPFMRCHMQNGYGIYMRSPQPLQQDFEFEKLRFRHNEKLSQSVFDMMKGGKLIYPHEGLKHAEFIIDEIRKLSVFSEDAFQYALYRSHYFRLKDAEHVKACLSAFRVAGVSIEIQERHPWNLSAGRRKKIDGVYEDFSLESWYGLRVLDRKKIPAPSPMFEPWMMPEETDGEGVKDFRVREKVECGLSIVERDMFNLLRTLMTAQLQDF